MGFWDTVTNKSTTITEVADNTWVVKGATNAVGPFASLAGLILAPLFIMALIWGFFSHLVIEPISERTTDWVGGKTQYVWCGDSNQSDYFVDASIIDGKFYIKTVTNAPIKRQMIPSDTQHIYVTADTSSPLVMTDASTNATFTYDNATRTMTATGLRRGLDNPTGERIWTDCRVRND